MKEPPSPNPQDRFPDDNPTRSIRDGHDNDRRHHDSHADDDRLTEADLDRREHDRRSTHAG